MRHVRRFVAAPVVAMAGVAVGIAVPAAHADSTKFTFDDVSLPDGQTGEIEAGVKVHKHKPDSVTCAYFTDDYGESLGYYFDFHEPAPTEADAVLAICLDEFDERNT